MHASSANNWALAALAAKGFVLSQLVWWPHMCNGGCMSSTTTDSCNIKRYCWHHGQQHGNAYNVLYD
jgi:hypothetical protein